MNPFFRGAGAVVAGYVAMFITVFVTFSLAYVLMGPDRAFQPDVYDVSTTWIVVTFIVSWSAATLGGKVCHLIARSTTAPKYLIALVGVLGLAQLIGAIMVEPAAPGARVAGEPSMVEAMSTAIQPLWITVVNPIIGMLGTAYGSGLLRKRSAAD